MVRSSTRATVAETDSTVKRLGDSLAGSSKYRAWAGQADAHKVTGAFAKADPWQHGLIEFEVAVELGEDVASGTPPDEAAAAVSAVGAAIELADVDLPVTADAVSEIVAGNIFHKHVILGVMDRTRSGIDVGGLVGRVFIDGLEHSATTDLEAMTGRYPDIVATVAGTVASQGERLRAGDVIITGSIVAPIALGGSGTFSFALDPLPPISVTVDTGS